MEKFSLPKMENPRNYNRGQLFEYSVSKFFLPEQRFSLDNIPYWQSPDIPELEINVKLVNKCSLGYMENTNLEEFINFYLDRDVSKNYIVGFDMIDSKNYIALKMNKVEFKEFILKYGKAERNGDKWKARIILTSNYGQKFCLKKMGF